MDALFKEKSINSSAKNHLRNTFNKTRDKKIYNLKYVDGNAR